jgi:PTH1 family peptidyl-tRNA hydrolase
MLRLAVFLGNPGEACRRNRHNAGRLLVERLPRCENLHWTKKFRGLYAALDTGRGEGGTVHLLMPETYMNLSGRSAHDAAAFYRIDPKEMIIVHDELELETGIVSFKFGGGLSGHNGLRSLRDSFGTADFWRLRLGIGRPPGRRPGEGGLPVKGAHDGGPGDVASWVLSDFGAAEEPALLAALNAAAGALIAAFEQGPESLLPKWKKKSAAES